MQRYRYGDRLLGHDITILRTILAGHTTIHVIAAHCHYSRTTVGSGLSRIYHKTGAANMAHLCLMAGFIVSCPPNLLAALREVGAHVPENKGGVGSAPGSDA